VEPPGVCALARVFPCERRFDGPSYAKEAILPQLTLLAQATGTDGVGHAMAHSGTSGQVIAMAARAGIEPASAFLQAVITALTSESVSDAGAQKRAQDLCELSEVLGTWWSIAPEIRAAILTMVRAAKRPIWLRPFWAGHPPSQRSPAYGPEKLDHAEAYRAHSHSSGQADKKRAPTQAFETVETGAQSHCGHDHG